MIYWKGWKNPQKKDEKNVNKKGRDSTDAGNFKVFSRISQRLFLG